MRSTITQKQVADRAGVSRSTVRDVVNGTGCVTETMRARVEEALRELNYRPHASARALRSGRSNIIGVISRAVPVVSTAPETEQEVVDTTVIADAIRKRGYNVALITIDSDLGGHEPSFEEMISLQVEGVVVNRVVYSQCRPQVAMLREAGIEVVLIGSSENDDVDGLREDDKAGMFEVTSHLLELGHRRISFLGFIHGIYIGFQMRLEGYKQAMSEAGLPVGDDDLVDLVKFASENRCRMGYDAMSWVLDNGSLPDAVVCTADEVAFGAISAIYNRGLKVPDDIALVGFNGIVLSAFTATPLTTVAIPIQELAEGAVDLLFKRIDGEISSPEPQFKILNPRLMVRESCGAELRRSRL